MADYSMEDSNWNAKKADIDEWFEANPDHSSRKAITDGLFAIGDIQTDFRKRHWSAIAGVFSDLPNSPIGRGRQSLMDVTDKSHLDTHLVNVYDAYCAFYRVASTTLKTHGKSGGILYETMENGEDAYATEMTKKDRLFIMSAYNACKSNDSDKRYWASFDEEGALSIVDNGLIGGSEEE
jgi:hypothetical protein|tara:strand:+ start:110 stop:649 length:540 start_codon:yes stop_codon:yes gene_type:complete